MSAPFWAVLEQFGHVTLVGEVSEVEMFGGKLGQIDVLRRDGSRETKYFGHGSVYGLTPVTEEAARERVKPYASFAPRALPAAEPDYDEFMPGELPGIDHTVDEDGTIRFEFRTDDDGEACFSTQTSPLQPNTRYDVVAVEGDERLSFCVETTGLGSFLWWPETSPLRAETQYRFEARVSDQGDGETEGGGA